MALSNKQQAFVEAYLTTWNGAEAARRAGYHTKANVQGSRMLANASIKEAIQARLADLTMGADEVLARLTDQARGSLADFVDVSEASADLRAATDVQDAKAIAGGWRLNLVKAEQSGKLHLLKKLKSGQWGPEIELYDAQAALALLGKHHGLFVERHEHSGPDGGPIPVVSAADLALARAAAQSFDTDDDDARSAA